MVKEDLHTLERMLQYENNNSLLYCSSFNPLDCELWSFTTQEWASPVAQW